PRSLHALSNVTGIPRATAHRLAVALESHGLLRRDEEGRFDLGPELAALGRITAERYPLAELALPALTTLRDATGESVQLFVREGNLRRCVLSLQSPHALRWIVPEGVLFPLELGSAGRVLSGERTEPGWIESVEEREPGVASVSAPVLGVDGTAIAAVSVSGPIDRLSRSPGPRFGQWVVDAADEVAVVVRGDHL
ncbi:MAG: IclR family transcriptional regulator, partial [Acidimicrobiia bacterium]